MDLNDILKAIVPLAFLAIWALTAVFNKEGNSLPVRSQGPPNPYGPRPGVPPRVAGPADRPPTLRWGTPGSTPAPPRPGGDDDIVILESSRPARPAPGRGVAPRRLRPKPATAVAAKPAPIVPTNKFGLGHVSQTVNQQLATPVAMEPLIAPLSGVGSRPAASAAAKAVDHIAGPTLRAASIAVTLADPQRLREAILINELLQPPLALRRGLNRRR